ADGFGGNFTTSFANPGGTNPFSFLAPVQPGVNVTGTVNPASILGFNFNQPSIGLGNNVVVDPGIIGYHGLGSLGVGRVSATSDTFNLLVRALKQQGRIDVLTRPTVMTLDNQAAQVAVGQSVPYTTGSATAAATTTTTVTYRDVGVILNVIPKISPEGKVF